MHTILLMALLHMPAMLRKYFLGALAISWQRTKIVSDGRLWPAAGCQAGQKGGSERGQEDVRAQGGGTQN